MLSHNFHLYQPSTSAILSMHQLEYENDSLEKCCLYTPFLLQQGDDQLSIQLLLLLFEHGSSTYPGTLKGILHVSGTINPKPNTVSSPEALFLYKAAEILASIK